MARTRGAFAVVWIVLAASCSDTAAPPPRENVRPPTGQWQPDAGYTPTEDESRAAEVARAALAPVRPNADARFRVTPHADGYSVFVLHAVGYREDEPVGIPGAHTTIQVSHDFTVSQIVRGR